MRRPSRERGGSRRFASACSRRRSKRHSRSSTATLGRRGDRVRPRATRRSARPARGTAPRARAYAAPTSAWNSSPSRSIRSGSPSPAPRRPSSASSASTNVRSGSRPSSTGQVQLEHARRARARARSPGRRATSRRSGRRRRRRRARAPAGSPRPTARRGGGEQRRLGPGAISGAVEDELPDALAELACRPGSRVETTSRPARAGAPRGARACVRLPEPSTPSIATNTPTD